MQKKKKTDDKQKRESRAVSIRNIYISNILVCWVTVMTGIKSALISVHDKTGITEFARGLCEKNVRLISSGGTASRIREAGIDVEDVSTITGFPEMLDGRVKTLHPKIHGGILAKRTKDHLSQISDKGISTIDMVVVNLYPFRETVAKGCSLEEAVEQIDIGGPTLIRSAAKNHESVAVVVDPSDYNMILDSMGQDNSLSDELMMDLAYKAFDHTARYDIAISSYLWGQRHPEDPFPPHLNLTFKKEFQTRYGENPHQRGSFYKEETTVPSCAANAKQLHGKQLSFNNLLDLNDALELIKEFPERPTVAEIKHTNPCGIASADTISEAYRMAHSIDPMSAFGGVIASNRPIDKGLADQMKEFFVECVIAPGYTPEALEILTQKKNIRIMETGELEAALHHMDYKRIVGGLLVQDGNTKKLEWDECKIVTKRRPTTEEKQGLEFAWRLVKNVKSNAVVYSTKDMGIGIGAGQMSRVDSAIIAARKGGDRVKGCVMASDAFFPFRDAVDQAAEAGITAAIHPGGSMRDEEVVEAADQHNMAMVFTGYRVFKH